ncbi:MAG: hypothetical protein ACFFCV_17315 [Promethearchaeota archaeon]
MVKNQEKPYGYIYRATNIKNGKNYIGQTVSSRWADDKIPIEERWKEEIQEGFAKQKRGEKRRYIENAVIKHGEENFKLKTEDVAKNQEELDRKEDDNIIKYDTMNPDKGYNMREGGRGGRLSERLKEYLSERGLEKWQYDLEYQEKQIKERQARAKDPEWLNKMTEVNQEIARNPETLDKMSQSLSDKWKDQKYQDNVSKGVTNKWQEYKYRKRQFNSRANGRREITDKREFLNDIQEMKKKDLNEKHDIDGKCMNRRIKEMLGHRGVNNFSQAKKYLEGKNLDEVLKDINERMRNQPDKSGVKKEIDNKQEFLKDIQNLSNKELAQKYGMNRTTVNKRIREMFGEHGVKNYTEAKEYLKEKNLDDVVKDINERLSNQTEKYEGKSEIQDKREFLEDIQNLQKNEIDHKYGMDAKIINNKIKEMLGEYGVKNYTEAKEYLKDKNLDDVARDIDERNAEKQDEKQTSDTKPEGPEKHPIQEHEEEEEKKKSSEENEKESAQEEGKDISEENPALSTEEESDEIQEESLTGEGQEPLEKQEDVPSEANINNHSFETSGLAPEHTPGEVKTLIPGDAPQKTPKDKTEGGRVLVDEWHLNEPEYRSVYDPKNVAKQAKDYDGIDKCSGEESNDYQGIDEPSEGGHEEFEGLGEEPGSDGRDFDGIDEPSSEEGKDYDYVDEGYSEGG